MKHIIASCLLVAAVAILAGCTDAAGYERTCVMKNNTVRGDCDKPGQSEESDGYQPR